MSYIKKGDLIEARGRKWIALGSNYTKLIMEFEGGMDMSCAVGALKAVPADDSSGSAVELFFGRDKVTLIEKASEQ